MPNQGTSVLVVGTCSKIANGYLTILVKNIVCGALPAEPSTTETALGSNTPSPTKWCKFVATISPDDSADVAS